mmetsp:Transcript_1952/g.5779  ORF Transcript_1952/g.5779 Transcript_1952/m.5779 type:complete len:235 (+) Transcript_1952:734-1438(+)
MAIAFRDMQPMVAARSMDRDHEHRVNARTVLDQHLRRRVIPKKQGVMQWGPVSLPLGATLMRLVHGRAALDEHFYEVRVPATARDEQYALEAAVHRVFDFHAGVEAFCDRGGVPNVRRLDDQIMRALQRRAVRLPVRRERWGPGVPPDALERHRLRHAAVAVAHVVRRRLDRGPLGSPPDEHDLADRRRLAPSAPLFARLLARLDAGAHGVNSVRAFLEFIDLLPQGDFCLRLG